MKNDDKDDRKWIADVCRVLDQENADLDRAAEQRLKNLKYMALDSQTGPRRLPFTTGISAVAIALLVIFLWQIPVAESPRRDFDPLMLDLFSGQESLDFYQQDIEFYEWLSEVMDDEKEIPEPRRDVHSGNFFSPAQLVDGSGAETEGASRSRVDRVPGRVRG